MCVVVGAWPVWLGSGLCSFVAFVCPTFTLQDAALAQ